MALGEAGTSRKSGRTVQYTWHATAYSFDGVRFRKVVVPSIPWAGARPPR
jgi:hypothetical protein